MGRKLWAYFSPTPGQKGGWQGEERTGLAGLEDALGITDHLREEGEPGLHANTGGQLLALRWLTLGSRKGRAKPRGLSKGMQLAYIFQASPVPCSRLWGRSESGFPDTLQKTRKGMRGVSVEH